MIIKNRAFLLSFLIATALYLFLMPTLGLRANAIFKALPILILIMLTLYLAPQLKKLLVLALSLSLAGDLVLTQPGQENLKFGMVFFALAHIAYIRLFIKQGLVASKRIKLFVPIIFFVSFNLYLLWPYFLGLQTPVLFYVLILTSMVFYSFQLKTGYFLTSSGALLFMLSDYYLALNEFSNSIYNYHYIVLIFYYTAQLFLVMGITKPFFIKKAKNSLQTVI